MTRLDTPPSSDRRHPVSAIALGGRWGSAAPTPLRPPLESAQYASGPYRATLARHRLVQSMSRKGNCLDNAPMESFFGSLKTELVHRASFPTREAAKRAIFEYVEVFYNRRRRRGARIGLLVGDGAAAGVGKRSLAAPGCPPCPSS